MKPLPMQPAKQPVTSASLVDNILLTGKQPADNATAAPASPGDWLTSHRLTRQRLISPPSIRSLLSRSLFTDTPFADLSLTDTSFNDALCADSLYNDVLSAADHQPPQALPLTLLSSTVAPGSARATSRQQTGDQTLEHFLCRFQLQPPPAAPASALTQPRMAAVLLPVILRSPPTLLFTVRSAHLKRHQGQIAFPGGVYDDSDRALSVTALRETEEEIDIPASAVRLSGSLPTQDCTSGFRVTPFIGLISPATRWQANNAEVADIFEIPLAQILTCARYHSLWVIRQQRKQLVWFSWYQNHCIWGLTAKILWQLADQVRTE